MFRTTSLFVLFALASPSLAQARQWSDATGKYTLLADMIAFGDTTVVLEKRNSDLVAVPINKLSDGDRRYLNNQSAKLRKSTGPVQIWTLKSGLKLPGQVVGYDKRDLVIRRRLGRVYVNDQRLGKMPGVYREIIPKIVEHFTGDKIDGEKGLEDWAKNLKGESKTFECAGVMIELEDGHLYCTPLFLFTDEVMKVLKPGWERWLAAKEDYEKKKQESFLVRAQAEADRRKERQSQQIQQLQLNLQSYDAGLFDLWEVKMYPPGGSYGMPLSVIVPALDSWKAVEMAKQQNPSYVVGSMRVVRRRN